MSTKTNPAFIVLFVLAIIFSCPFLTCTGWFFYDGIVTYPNQRQRALEFERIRQSHPSDWQQIWIKTAQQNGWPVEQPDPPMSEWDIRAQFVYGGVCSFLSLACVVVAIVFGILMTRDKTPEQPQPH